MSLSGATGASPNLPALFLGTEIEMLRGLRRQFPNNLPMLAGNMQLVRVVNPLPVNPVKPGEILRFDLLLERIKDFPGIIVEHGPVFWTGDPTFPIKAPQAA